MRSARVRYHGACVGLPVEAEAPKNWSCPACLSARARARCVSVRVFVCAVCMLCVRAVCA